MSIRRQRPKCCRMNVETKRWLAIPASDIEDCTVGDYLADACAGRALLQALVLVHVRGTADRCPNVQAIKANQSYIAWPQQQVVIVGSDLKTPNRCQRRQFGATRSACEYNVFRNTSGEWKKGAVKTVDGYRSIEGGLQGINH